jgi:uncharacterized membrane protein YkoI
MNRRKLYTVAIVGALVAGAAGAFATLNASAGGEGGGLDDGKDLLPQARITLAEAIAAAQSTGDGAVGEVDLEYWQGNLVFNVDIGKDDVKVDALTGRVIGSQSDD